MQSTPYSMIHADDEKLEIHSEEDVQVNIQTQRCQTQKGDRGGEDTDSQKLKSGLFVHHFTKI